MTRIVFAGTPEFARESLRALVDAGKRPVAVLTQPDRPAGRGKKLTPSPVKQYAETHEIPVFQPATLKNEEVRVVLKELRVEILIVAAYGLLLPQEILDIPATACVNVHASLLPRWRGAAPIQASILAGDRQTGICLMQMEAGLDTGPVYCKAAIEIGLDESAGELHDRLARLGGELLVRNIDAIADGTLSAVAQDDKESSYAPKIRTADAAIDWSRSAVELHRHIRAYNPVPGAWTVLGEERLKCWRAGTLDSMNGNAGLIVAAGDDGIDVCCGTGGLRVTQWQRPGKGRVTAPELAAQLGLVGRTLG